MRTWLKRFLTDERGQGSIEYGIIIVLASIAAMAALHALGNKTNSTFLGNAGNQFPG
jgi:Flp pilus assembly pilin Flp